MRESRENPADEVKNEISQVTEAIFDIIAKDKKKKHIAEDVSDAAVHEHRSDQREISGNGSTGHSGRLYGLPGNRLDHETAGDRPIIAGNDSLGNCRKLRGELLVAAEALEQHKHQHVSRDEHIVNDRRGGAASVIVAYWKKHASLFTLNVLTSYIRLVLFFSEWMSATRYMKSNLNGTNESLRQIFASTKSHLKQHENISSIHYYEYLTQPL